MLAQADAARASMGRLGVRVGVQEVKRQALTFTAGAVAGSVGTLALAYGLLVREIKRRW